MHSEYRIFRHVNILLRLLPAFCLVLLACADAAAQETPDEDILIDLTVNYGVAFREGSWAPVDVFINNTQRDVSGFVEIRTYDFSGTLQSPTYRVPADSPKGSRKRFRVHCKLERADRMEAQLYHGNRAVSPVPARLNLTPIDRNDLLGLVLDDQHHDYGFLSSGGVIGKADTRFHREGLTTGQLGALADHLPCFTAFDLIILGNIDPERITPHHRDLIQHYVAMGGSLAVSLGQNANRYKGSWLEPLMGVTIGENTFLAETALAGQAFSDPADAAGLADTRAGMVTAIAPANESVASIANNYALGAIHPVGAGRVATFTVDATSGLMQNSPAFQRVWNRLLGQSILDRPLNMPAAIESATQQLPTIAGVKLFPVSSVIAYLLLYFFVAIVGNWLFWNWRKRREMAWVCLVFFSFAFTGYAMIFGTQGRARTTELEQLEILELGSNTPVGTLHGITGLLAKGSGRFNATLLHPDTLVSDAARTQFLGMQQPGGVFGPQSETPFQFIQDSPGRVESLTVGASEMRFLQTQAPVQLDGALETDLIADSEGLRGTIHNRTGLDLVNALLIHEGSTTPIEFSDGRAEITGAPAEQRQLDVRGMNIPPGKAYTAPPDMDRQDHSAFLEYLTWFPGSVLNQRGAALPTCLVAWSNGPPLGSIDMGDRAQIRLGATLVVAWLDVKRPALPPVQQLAIHIQHQGYPGSGYAPTPDGPIQSAEDWTNAATFMDVGTGWEVGIAVPNWLRASDRYTLELKVSTDNRQYRGNHGRCVQHSNPANEALSLKFADPENNPLSLGAPRVTEFDAGNELTVHTRTYVMDEWNALLPPRATAIQFTAFPEGTSMPQGNANFGYPPQMYMGQGYPGQRTGLSAVHYGADHYHVAISARMIDRNTQTTGE